MTTPARDRFTADLGFIADPTFEEMLQAVLDEHAHRLAEQIREDAQARHDRDFSDNRIFRLNGARAGADLIDPEVQR